MNDPKVLLLIPSSGVLADGLAKWCSWMVLNAPYYFEWDIHYGRPNDDARNGIVQRFLQSPKKFTHLWQIDDDIIPPLHAYQMVLHDKAIISASVLIWLKGEPLTLIMEWNNKEEGYKQDFDAITKINSGERLIKLKPQGVSGTGCFIVKREVYENLVTNWFRYGYDNNGQMITGQDFNFFKRCNEIGYSVWIDGGVQCGHFKRMDILEVQNTLIRQQQRIRREYDENNKSND